MRNRVKASTGKSTEQKIIQAALELFASKGFAATGIRELAERSGVTSAALYHYMGTKESLLAHLMTTGNSRVLSAARQALSAARTPEDRLATLVHVHVLAHTHYQLETAVIDHEIRALPPEHYASVVAIRDTYEAIWQETLEDGINEGVFVINDTKIARLALLEMCTGVTYWYQPTGPLTPPTIAREFADFALALVRAQRDLRPVGVQDVKVPATEWLADLLAEK